VNNHRARIRRGSPETFPCSGAGCVVNTASISVISFDSHDVFGVIFERWKRTYHSVFWKMELSSVIIATQQNSLFLK
jgi:hypothetical protein